MQVWSRIIGAESLRHVFVRTAVVRSATVILLAHLLAAVALGPVQAQRTTDLELVLLADATGSIDDGEIMLQRRGYATAITNPEVLAAITSGFDGRIAVTYVEWADAGSQAVVVPWTIIDGSDAAAAFAEALMRPPRQAYGSNAIGAAILRGQELIESNDIEGFRKVIDFSADSANNWNGPPISEARRSALSAGIVINGLAILCRATDCYSGRPVSYDLEAAFEREIIGGAGAFVVTVEDNASFADAVRRKLLLEISGRTPGDDTPVQQVWSGIGVQAPLAPQ